jgi:hypothetical protein
MSWDAVAALAELAGAIAVVATLAYLARQIRENTNAVQGATELDVAEQLASWYSRRTTEERLLHARAVRGEALSDVDAATYMWMQAEYFHLSEGWYRQYARGLMKSEVWEPLADAAIAILASPVMLGWWEQRLSPLSAEFRRTIDERRAQFPDRWTLKPATDVFEAARQAERR